MGSEAKFCHHKKPMDNISIIKLVGKLAIDGFGSDRIIRIITIAKVFHYALISFLGNRCSRKVVFLVRFIPRSVSKVIF